jgi:predicted TIM-barrel fold metal-dependent hydrolase
MLREPATLPDVAIFDAHFHIIDPRFPLVANQGYEPEPFTVGDYRHRMRPLGVTGGAVVSGSFQGYDQTYLIDALEQLGPGFVGVANVPPEITDDEVLELYAAGVRAFRINLYRGGDLDQLEQAERFAELVGWHLEVYLDGRDLPELAPRLARHRGW